MDESDPPSRGGLEVVQNLPERERAEVQLLVEQRRVNDWIELFGWEGTGESLRKRK
jgi:hypothetical protein